MKQRKFFALVFVLMLLFAGFVSAGCGGGGGRTLYNLPDNPVPDVPEVPESPDIPQESEYYSVIFDSNGGSEIESQTVKAGEKAATPDAPVNGDLYFLGWYKSLGYSKMFDFNTPISQDIILYAKWYDVTDTTDSDGDGLSDSLEDTFGTDPNNQDTDDDGLTDHDELNWLDYNPLEPDTDGNGILDGDEDPDNDKLTNIQEANLNTNMILRDSDGDGISDYDEINIYHTDPLKPDSDNDGVKDGLEIIIGSDPLKYETSFTTTVSSNKIELGNDEAIDIQVSMKSSANAAGTLEVARASRYDNILISPAIPGYLNAAYNLTASGDFESASITFTLGKKVGTISDKFQPRIYYLDEDTGLFEELPNQQITSDGRITASVTHFSIYVLLNKIDFDSVWSNDIKPVGRTASGDNTSMDIVFVIDASGSMRGNDPNRIAIELSKNFVSKLNNTDRAAVVEFNEYSYIRQTLTNNKNAITQALDSIRYYGLTYILGGLEKAVNILEYSEAGYKYIILLTDGYDGYDYSYYNGLIKTAVDNNIIIYTIGMGDAVEYILKNIASDTNGKYYHAEASSTPGTNYDLGDVISLDQAFSDIESETIDTAKDSNNDGIPDYYAELINTGQIKMSNGEAYLIGVLDKFGDSDDWDEDGLKNGEEIEFLSNRNGVLYYNMKSDPLLYDTDLDGYSDYQEVKVMYTSPKQMTISWELLKLIYDEYFSEEKVRKYLEFSRPDINDLYDLYDLYNLYNRYNPNMPLVTPLDSRKIDQAEKTLIEYLTTYRTTEIISRDAEAAARLVTYQNWIDGLHLASSFASVLNNLITLGGDLASGKQNASEFEKEDLERMEKALKNSSTVYNGLINAAKTNNQELNKALRSAASRLSDAAGYATLYDITGKTDAIREFIAGSEETAGFGETISSIIKLSDDFAQSETGWGQAGTVMDVVNNITDSAKQLDALRKQFFRIEIPFSWTWAENLNTELFSINGNNFTKLNVVGGILTIVTDAFTTLEDIVKVRKIFGSIEANYAEFQQYIGILTHIAYDGNKFPNYVRYAAQKTAERFINGTPDWKAFNNRCTELMLKEAAQGIGQIIADGTLAVLTVAHPVVGIAMSVLNIVKDGVEQRERALINAQVYYALARGSVHNLGLNKIIRLVDAGLDFDKSNKANVYKYSLQLAQARIKGLGDMMEYLLKFDSWDANWFEKGAVKEEYTAMIKEVYYIAKKCLLELSDKLPMYDEFGSN